MTRGDRNSIVAGKNDPKPVYPLGHTGGTDLAQSGRKSGMSHPLTAETSSLTGDSRQPNRLVDMVRALQIVAQAMLALANVTPGR